jgi:DNA-directed RNA polymerase I and III subunit RPAC1
VFRLKATCERKKNAPKDATDPKMVFVDSEILSSQLEWVPQGEQGTVISANPPAPTNPNIVLAKMRPGQEIDMEVHAVKGVGKDHAKFCPVGEHTGNYLFVPLDPVDLLLAATASYRLLPEIILNPAKPVPPDLAEKFQKCFSSGVIRVHPRTKKVSVDEKSARFESMSREVYRHPEFEGCVQLARVRDHFLCARCLSPYRSYLIRLLSSLHRIRGILPSGTSTTRGDSGDADKNHYAASRRRSTPE